MYNHQKRFLTIAKAFHTPEKEGTKKQVNIAKYGLCAAYLRTEECHPLGWLIDDNRFRKLLYKLKQKGWWYPARSYRSHDFKREYDLIRGDIAMLFSCMTEEEFKQLLR